MHDRRLCIRVAVIAALLFLSAYATSPAPPAAAYDERLPVGQRLDALVPSLLDKYRVPGAAVVVIEDQTTFLRGYGRRRSDLPETVGPDTVFEAASLGKPVFAYAMMQRVAAGELDLDRPLSASLDEPYITDDARIEDITARHVLSHTTGFPNWRPKRFTDKPGPLRIRHDPGSQYGYSGEGYSYLQIVVERDSGQALEDLMQTSLFGPLSMTRSGYLWSDHFEPDYVWPHNSWGTAGYKWYPDDAQVAFALHSTAADFARFLEAMLAEDDAVAKAMLAPQVTLPGVAQLAWSLGWGIEKRPDDDWFWHWGDNGRFKHFVIGSRGQRRAVLVMTNASNGANVYRAVVEAALGFLPRALDLDVINY